MEGMFRDCSELTTLDVSNFETHSTVLSNMFANCSKLKVLDLHGFISVGIVSWSEKMLQGTNLRAICLGDYTKIDASWPGLSQVWARNDEDQPISGTDLMRGVMYYRVLSVNYDYQGHGGANTTVQNLALHTVKKPADPEDNGYDFTGWYIDEACTQLFSFDSVIEDDLTLYAGWSKKIVSIELDADNLLCGTQIVTEFNDAGEVIRQQNAPQISIKSEITDYALSETVSISVYWGKQGSDGAEFFDGITQGGSVYQAIVIIQTEDRNVFTENLTVIINENTHEARVININQEKTQIMLEIPMTAMHYSGNEWTVVQEPTCTEAGKKEQRCTVCNELLHEETIPATGHTPGEWEVIKEPTMTEDGERILKCSVCGEIFEREPIPRLNKNGLIQEDGKWYYYVDDQKQTGWKQIDGEWYWFSSTGAAMTGWGKSGNKWYYMDETGKMMTGWIETGGKRYYMNADGTMHAQGWFNDNGAWYYLDSSGAAVTGWKQIGSTWYFFDKTTGAMKTGWFEDGGKKYCMSDSGAMKTGWQSDNGTWYWLDSSGAAVKGWKQVGSTWYFFDKTTCAMKTGWFEDGGKKYFMNDSGAMVTGWLHWDDAWYYLSGSGAVMTGWTKVGTTWYYMDAEGKMQTGWVELNGAKYYMKSGGAMVTGWQQIDGKWYNFNSSGVMQVSKWIGNYYVKEDGTMAVNEWIGNYHVDANGVWDATR